MDGTPKLQRKSSLSLSTRLNHKRHSASPQNRLKTSTSGCGSNSRKSSGNCDALQRSPSVMSICSDGGIECTPPHKKRIMSLDDSLEYSPKVLDSSFSPTCLLSQTLAIDSPEVGWRWSRHSDKAVEKSVEDDSSRTPDSAYAADSSFASVGSSSTELVTNVRTRRDSYQQRFTYESRREDQRKLLEQELRRVEKIRIEEKLKERCAKLQEQLKSAGSQKSKIKKSKTDGDFKKNETSNQSSFHSNSKTDVDLKPDSTVPAVCHISGMKIKSHEKPEKTEIINDFYNDSDSDCLLLAATQEIELKMDTKTQPAFINIKATTTQSSTSSECISLPHANSAPAATTTPPKATIPPILVSSSNSENKEKRASFYMKFLEDDCPDDWFVSLDEVILQATQTKKSRTCLQRYKSMPAETISKPSVQPNGDDNCKIDSEITSKRQDMNLDDSVASSSTFSRMKRHSSIHTLSPASSSYKSRRQL